MGLTRTRGSHTAVAISVTEEQLGKLRLARLTGKRGS